MSTSGLLWTLALLVPLLWTGATAAVGLLGADAAGRPRDLLGRFAWLATVPAGLLAALGADPVHVPWMLFGTHLALDDVARPLLAMAVVLYGLALAFVPRSKADRVPTLTALLLVCFVGNAGVVVAADTVTFYLAFTVMSFAGYLLVVHDRAPASRRAGSIYLVMTVLGEAAVLTAVVLVARAGGMLLADAPAAVAASGDRDLIIALALVGFGVKAGTVPLHVWLPLAHPAAPTPASAVLSGAMVKAGLVGWLRFLPLGEVETSTWGTVLLLLALVGGFLAVPVGLLQDDPKVILAYSSISQMGFLAVLVGAALAAPGIAGACVLAATVYAVHHGLAKGALFLGVQAWDTERLPRGVVTAAMVVAGLSVAGAPLTSGYVAKYGAKEAVGDVTFPVGAGVALADVLPWIGLGSTLLLLRLAVVMSRRERRPAPTPVARDAAWALVAVLAVVPVLLLARELEPTQSVPGLADPGVLWDQSWPLLVGIGLAGAAVRLTRSPRLEDSRVAHPRGDLVPPGDLVAVEERAVLALGRGLGAASARGRRARDAVGARLAATPSPLPWLGRLQMRNGAWATSGAVTLLAAALVVGWAATKAVS